MNPRPALGACSLACATLVAACSLTAEPVDDVLAHPAESMSVSEAGTAALAELDARCRSAMETARANPQDVDAAVAAARVLFQAADLRFQLGTLAAIEAGKLADLDEILTADDDVDDATQAAILSLATEGVALTERAILARENDVGAHLYHGLHLTLVAWANGPARSLFAGYGKQIVKAIDRAVALDPAYQAGGPLRLQGRFRAKAPWPYGDLDAARTALLRSVELGPVPVGHLFLGDLHHARGERALALEQWQKATTAEPDEATRWSAEAVRELARRRLRAARESRP